ncbi:MAG: hypothetical protein LBH71_00035 [Oscillospiraceae bacterium]|jgi:hypothetical protein|nr:hypothetical protein [Oscillospiraceae bacterium]
MIIIGILMLITVVIIGAGFLFTLLGLFFLNWGPGAAYDYTGHNMNKSQAPKKSK